MLAPDDVRPHCCFIPQGIFRESRQTRGDEDLEHTESMMAIEQLFDQLDKDHSGIIAYDEWENFMVQFIRRRCVCCAPPEWLFAVQMGSILNHAKAQMNHELSPPGGFPSAFNRGSLIEPYIETLSRVHTQTVREVPKGHSGAPNCPSPLS